MPTDGLITLKEAATLLEVTTTTLRNWDRIGRLKAVRNPGNNYRLYRFADVIHLRNQSSFSAWDRPGEDRARYSGDGQSMSLAGVKRLVKTLHRVLRDSEGSSSLIERFDELTKILYCKVYDERKVRQGEKSAFTESTGVNGRRNQAIRPLFAGLVSAREDLFPAKFCDLRLSEATLDRLAQILAPMDISSSEHDFKGIAYEEVIRNTFDKGDNQQYLTPFQVVEFMVAMMRPMMKGVVCDPACGTGRFLVETHKHNNIMHGHRLKLLGIEIDERMAWVSRINLDMHNLDSFEILQMPKSGSLGDGVDQLLGKIDVVITNPPFGSDFLDPERLNAFSLGSNRSSRRRGVLFIERALDLLRPGGAVAIIIDDSVLNGQANTDVRQLILERSEVLGVVSLPETTFMPYAAVKASILFLKKRAKSGGNTHGRPTFFAEADRVGKKHNGDPLFEFNPETGRIELSSDLPGILEAWQDGEHEGDLIENGGRAFWAKLPSIGDESYARDNHRIDLAYNHPARAQATAALKNSPFPVMALRDVCDERNEPVVPSTDLKDEEIVFIGLANIEARNGVCRPSIVSAKTIKSTVKRFIADDILFAKMRPELRKVCLVPSDFEEGFASSECIVLVPKLDSGADKPTVMPAFLELLLRSDLVFGQLMHMVIGIGRPRLSRQSVMNVKIPIPPLDRQSRLLRSFERRKKATDLLMQESEACVGKARRIMFGARKHFTEALLVKEDPQ